MADGQTYTVPGRDTPTLWNRDLAVGLAVGSFASVFTAGLGPIVGLAMMAAGGAIGAVVGKSRLEKEQRDGKEVSPPSFWNKTTVIGAWLGQMAGTMVGLAAGLAGAIIGGIDLSEPAQVGTAVVGTALGGLMGSAGGFLVGGIIGGRMGKKRLSKEYQEAQEYHLAQQQERPQPQRNSEYTVTPEMAAELEARLSKGKEVSQVEKLAQRRGQAPLEPAIPS